MEDIIRKIIVYANDKSCLPGEFCNNQGRGSRIAERVEAAIMLFIR